MDIRRREIIYPRPSYRVHLIIEMEEIQKMLTNPVLTLVGILLVLREIHNLVTAIKTLITQRNDALTVTSQSAIALLNDIKTALMRLSQLIKSH